MFKIKHKNIMVKVKGNFKVEFKMAKVNAKLRLILKEIKD